jgi:predicted transcriptional regulator of viral defense system
MTAASALETLKARGPTFRARDAQAAGLHWRDLYALRDAGEVIELSRGLFRFADAGGITGIDLLTVSRRAPHGMICLVSALAYWDLTDEIPGAVDLAVPRGSSRPVISYPPTRVHVFDARTFDFGRERVDLGAGEKIVISSRERAIVDVFRFRNRIGTDLAYAALRDYLRQPGARPGELMRLAKELRVAGPLRRATDVLLS